MTALEHDPGLQNVPGGVVADAEEIGQAGAGRSHAQRIRERRAKREKEGPPDLSLTIPPGDIVVVYKRPTIKALKKAAARRGALGANIQLLIDACERIDFRDPDTGARTPAAEETDTPDVAVRFDGRLSDLLKLNAGDPTEILIKTFEANDRAIVGHAKRLDDWASGEDLDAEADLEDDEVEAMLGGS